MSIASQHRILARCRLTDKWIMHASMPPVTFNVVTHGLYIVQMNSCTFLSMSVRYEFRANVQCTEPIMHSHGSPRTMSMWWIDDEQMVHWASSCHGLTRTEPGNHGTLASLIISPSHCWKGNILLRSLVKINTNTHSSILRFYLNLVSRGSMKKNSTRIEFSCALSTIRFELSGLKFGDSKQKIG